MSIRSFYVVSVQSSNLAIHRYVLAFESKKKKQDEKHVLILQRTDQFHPARRIIIAWAIYSCCLSMAYVKEVSLSSVHFDLISHRTMIIYSNVPSAICASIISSDHPSHNHQHRSLWLSLAHGFIIVSMIDYSQRFYSLWFQIFH